jgi:hypothetical protein
MEILKVKTFHHSCKWKFYKICVKQPIYKISSIKQNYIVYRSIKSVIIWKKKILKIIIIPSRTSNLLQIENGEILQKKNENFKINKAIESELLN